MLILDYPEWSQHTIMNVLIPAEVYKLSPELMCADKMLQQGSFEAAAIAKFNKKLGRPSIPVRSYIRLMFLKHYLNLSYPGLVIGVTQNLMYRHFCRIPLERKVPNKSTLSGATAKYGKETVSKTIEALSETMRQRRHSKGRSS